MRGWYLTLSAVWIGQGSIPLVARHVDVGAPVIVLFRVVVASVALGLVVAVRSGLGADRGAVARPRLLAWQPARCVAAGAVLAAHWIAQFAAYREAPAATVSLIIYLAPVALAAVAPVLLHERVTRRTVGALTLALLGVLLVASPDLRGGGGIGIAYAGFSATTLVAFFLLSKPMADVYGGLRTAFLAMAVAAVVVTPVVLRSGLGPVGRDWPWLVLLGLVHTALAHAISMSALARIPATHAAILGYLEPASVVVLAWLVLGEQPVPATFAGGLLIVFGGAVVVTGATAGEKDVAHVPR